MELILETREQDNETPVIAGAVALTPLPSSDYWSYRVQLSDEQAVLGFPKFSTIGIGFAVEDDWNTNMPYTVPTDELFSHIIKNKGDDTIDDAYVREAILMIQLAVIDERAVSRRQEFNDISHAVPTGTESAPGHLFEQVIRLLETSMREGQMLRAEADAARNALTAERLDVAYWRGKYEATVMDGLAPGGADETVPFDPNVPQLGVPADEAYRDHNGRIWVAHGGGDAGERRLYLAGWERGIEAADIDDMTSLTADVAVEAFPGASPIPDGTRGFVTLLAKLGVPTKDGRVLAADGKYEMPQDTPIHSLVDETVPHSPTEVVGRIVGLWPLGSEIYAVGVAGPELAEDLNTGRLVLRAEMDVVMGSETPSMIKSGHVRGARIARPEAFAWAS